MTPRLKFRGTPATDPPIRAHLNKHMFITPRRTFWANARRHVWPPRNHTRNLAEFRRIVRDILDRHQTLARITQHRNGAE